MYFVFNTKEDCQQAINDINSQLTFTNNITSTYASPIKDKNGKYVIKNPTKRGFKNFNKAFTCDEFENIELDNNE